MSKPVNPASLSSPTETDVKTTEKKPRQWLSIIHEFGTNTTAHGLPRVTRSTSLHNRIYWLIASLCFTGLMIFFIVRAILDYFGYPTQMDISFDPEWPRRFPAMTFCNIGRARLDTFRAPFLNFTNSLNITNTSDSSTLHVEQLPYIGPFILHQMNSNVSLEPFVFPLSTMLVSCTYNSVPCSEADFTSFVFSDYGRCYTFNAKAKNASDDSIRDGNQYGGSGKLEVGLYVQSHQYVPFLQDGVGAVVLIHDNIGAPLMDTEGFGSTPGRKHKFSFRKKRTTFVPAPYTSCSDTIEPWMESMFANYQNTDYGYSQALCYKLAIQIYTYQQCGCVSPYVWDMRSIILPGTTEVIYASLCNEADPCSVKAATMFLSTSGDTGTNDINCPGKCSRTDFIVRQSSRLAPAPWQLHDIRNFVENSSVELPPDWSTAWLDHIQRNYLGITVVRETTVVENNIQRASLTLIDVLSNIGGQTGLWLGISLLSIMELFEMLYRLLRYQCTVIMSAVRIN